MFKKLLMTAALFAVSATALAAEGTPYLGVNIGMDVSHFSFNDSFGNRNDLGGRSGLAGIFGGYGTTIYQNIYLAGEVFANVTGPDARADVSLNNGMSILRLKQKYSYGVSFIPGILISDHTMGFARLSLLDTQFSAKTTDVTGSYSNNQSAAGGQLGFGLQTSLTDSLDLRMEYDYTLYRSINFKNGVRTMPNTDQFNVGLVYKFGE